MEEITDNNKIFDFNNEQEELEFKYNFINIPWDDRTRHSKIWIVVLLVSIFVAIIALVANNFYIHYKRFQYIKTYKDIDVSCYRLRIDELPYVARLQSAKTSELLCLGAVVSQTSVLANGICVRFGKIRMYLGSTSDPRCRKGFSVDVAESVHHPGVISKKLVLLSSYENIEKCSVPITLGDELDVESPVDIIGRSFSHARTLSRQHITLAPVTFAEANFMDLDFNYTLVGTGITRCLVRAGDLVLQRGKLFALASFQRNKLPFFANLNPIKNEIKEIDTDIKIEKNVQRSEFDT